MKPEDLGALLNATDYRLHYNIDQHKQRLQNAILLLENKIVDGVNALETTSAGVLVGPKVNLKQAQKVHSKLATYFDETYGEGVRQVVAGYDDAADHVLTMYSDLDKSMKFTSFDKTMIQTLKEQDFAQFASYGLQAQEQVAQAIYAHVAGGATMGQLRGVIGGILLGSVDARGRSMATYATQFANDAVMNFHNAVALQKGADAGFTHFLYYGNIMLTTREFCARRAMRVYSREEIESWTHNWRGKSGPAMTNRGGYNCRHHWQPVLQEWVPEGSLPVNAYPTADERYAMTPEEGYLKKQLNQLRYNIKTGKSITLDTPLVADMWYHMHPQERKNLLTKWFDDKIFDNNPDAYDILNKPAVAGKAPPLDKAPPLKQTGAMLTESPNPKFPKPKVQITEELTEADIVPTPKPTPAPVPKKPPASQPAPTPIATTGTTNGKAWNDLTADEKKIFGNYGYKMKEGKFKYHPTFANVWESLSAEAQNAKIASWKKLGYSIPSDLPVKKIGATTQVIQDAAEIVPPPIKKTGFDKISTGVKVDANKPNWSMDAPGLAEEQFEKSLKFKSAGAVGFGEIEGAQVINASGQHLWGVLDNHPKLAKILKSTDEIVPDVTFYNKGALNLKGTLGSYGDKTYKMQLAAGQSRSFTHSLTLNQSAWSVGGDYYSTLRHEYGHHIDNILRATTNHQDEWRSIYKSYSKAEWYKIFGEYSSVDKYEGFAEAFAAYTSPLYKPGMMPANVEKYMKKILGDARDFTELAPEVKKVGFKSAAHQQMYDQYYNKFMKEKITPTYAKDYLRANASTVMNRLDDWQGTTQSYKPMALKLKFMQLDATEGMAFFGRAGSDVDANRLKRLVDEIPDEEIIRVRALTQAYYAQNKKTTVTLMRGTNGSNTGPKFRRMVNDIKASTPEAEWSKTFIEIPEPPLNGWTTSKSIAEAFSSSGKGIMTTTKIPVEDIFLPDELWPKRGFKGEKEFIVVRRKQQLYAISDIDSRYEVAKKAVKGQSGATASVSIDNTYTLNAAETGKAADVWFHSKPDFVNWKKDEALEYLEKKIAGVQKAYEAGEPIKVGPSDMGLGGGDTIIYLPNEGGAKFIQELQFIYDKLKESKYGTEELMNYVSANPWDD